MINPINTPITYNSSHTVNLETVEHNSSLAEKIRKKFSPSFAEKLISITNISTHPTCASFIENFKTFATLSARSEKSKMILSMCKKSIFLLTDNLTEILTISDISKNDLKKIEDASCAVFEKISSILLNFEEHLFKSPDIVCSGDTSLDNTALEELKAFCNHFKRLDISENVTRNENNVSRQHSMDLDTALMALHSSLKNFQDLANEKCHVNCNLIKPHNFLVKNRTNISTMISLGIITFNVIGLILNIRNQEIAFEAPDPNNSTQYSQEKIANIFGEFTQFFDHGKILYGLGFISSTVIASLLMINAWSSRHVSREEDYKEVRTGLLNNMNHGYEKIKDVSQLLKRFFPSNIAYFDDLSISTSINTSPAQLRQRHRSNSSPE